MRRTMLMAAVIGCLGANGAWGQSARDEDVPKNPRPVVVDRPPVGESRRSPVAEGGRFEIAVGESMKMEKGAYLGVATSPAPQVLRQQLGLPKGFGLVVDTVAPDSPAAEAGLKPLDVLQKINDQLLVNQQQMAALVRSFKPGETVKLTIIRLSKPTELSAKLVERDLPPLDDMRLGVPPVAQSGGTFDIELMPFNLVPRDPLIARPNREGARLFADQFNIVLDDGKIQLQLSGKDGKQTLVARDKEGKELFTGPIDTEEQRQALPPEIKAKLPELDRMSINGRAAGRPLPPSPGGDRPALPKSATRPKIESQPEAN